MAMTRLVAESASTSLKSSLLRKRWVVSVLLTVLVGSRRLALATASAAAAAAAAPAGKVAFTSPETRKEFCQFDSFEARCDNGEAIVMETAHYGRMRSGRCISGEGYIGCSANVMVYMDGQCSGRRHCLVAVASLADIVQPCRRDFTSYLEATYSCHKVAGDGAARCSSHDRPVQLVAETGTIFGAELLLEQELTGLGSGGGHILGSSAAATFSSGYHQHGPVGISSGPGDKELQLRHRRCSWQVRSSRGQRVVFKLSVYRPGRYPDSSSSSSSTSEHRSEQVDLQPSSAVHSSSDGGCPWSLSIEDGDTTVTRETLCSRTGTIATGIHLGNGGRTGSGRSMTTSGQIECQPMASGHLCTVHLDWPTGSASRNLEEEDLPIFALQYEVLGCPDVDPGNGAIVDRRDRDELVVRCPDSKETWYLTCGPDNRWIGEMFNCSTRVVAGPHKAQGTSMSFPHGLIAAIVLGLIFGLVIGTASLGALYVYRRSRKLPTSSSRHPGTTDIDDVIGMSSDDYGSEKLRLDTPHLHHHHLHFRPLTPSPAAAGAGTDCWRLQTFDYSHHVTDSTRGKGPATTLDLLSTPAATGQGSDYSTSGHQPIYCPSVGPATLTSGSMVRFAGSAVADTSDYETSSSGPPVVFSRCGRPNCSATAAGRVVGTYETPRFLLQNPTAVAIEPPLNATLTGRSAVPPSAAESKVYFELLDSGRRRAGHTTGGLNTTTIN